MQSKHKNIVVDKQIIKTVIAEKQQQIGKTILLQRAEHFDEHSCYVLVGIRRAGVMAIGREEKVETDIPYDLIELDYK